MTLVRFEILPLHLPLRYAWKLSRNSSSEKTNFIIKAKGGNHEGWGEVAPNIRYEETPERVLAEFETIKNLVTQLAQTGQWDSEISQLNICASLRMGFDMAWQRLQAQENGKMLWEWLGVEKPRKREMAYTIPVMDPGEIAGFITRENLNRFAWLKIKVNRELAAEMVVETLRLVKVPLAIDGNEAWTNPEDVARLTQKWNHQQILFLEQPLPARMKEEYKTLASQTAMPIWGDESILSSPEPEYWKSAFAGINVKLMKAGTLSNAIQLLKSAKNIGLQTMLGCMVETTVGISAALTLENLADFMDLDGFLLPQNEPFQWVKESNGVVHFPDPQ